MTDNHTYTMSIEVNVLTHLGIGLYSNIPAVLSELVANAWDADATKVTIDIYKHGNQITITDNGHGMTRNQINEKFLKVGYQKRNDESITPDGREPMGRKGIGKLSVFSIADTVDVLSTREGEKNGLRMSLPAIKALIADGASHPYHPDALDSADVTIACGTTIILRDLRSRLDLAEAPLRRRLARRFSVINGKDNFDVEINGLPIGPQDRDYFGHIEFVVLGCGQRWDRRAMHRPEKCDVRT